LEDEYTWTLYDIGSDEAFMVITDDYNSIEMEVPLTWDDYNGEPWYDGGDVVGAQLIVSPDLQGFLNTWNVPGVRFSVSDDLASLAGYLQLLNLVREDFMTECELEDRYDYEDNLYRGKYDIFTKCGGPGGPSYMVLSAVSRDDQFSYLILVEVQLLSDEDWDYAQHILDTFQVIGDLP
jgi:serine protease Do